MALTVAVGADGRAPSGLSVGSRVLTAGGTFQITKVNSDGSYASQKVDNQKLAASSIKPVTTDSIQKSITQAAAISTTKSASVEPWQQNMINTKAKGEVAMRAELERAQSIVDSGQSTPGTFRYINQMNALLNGAAIGEVIRGDWDNFTGYSGAYSQNVNTMKAAEAAAAAAAAKKQALADAEWTKRDELSWTGGKDAADISTSMDYLSQRGQAAVAGAGQSLADMSGIANTGVVVLAGAAVIMAVAKLFGK